MSAAKKGKRLRLCPKCSSSNVKPVMYGFPDQEAFAASERGEIVLGGCEIRPDSKPYECQDCGEPFGRSLVDTF